MNCQARIEIPGLWSRTAQCSRKAVGGTEWCKQHNPEEIEKRRQKTEHAQDVKREQRAKRYSNQVNGARYLAALEEIANGTCGNPIQTARKALRCK